MYPALIARASYCHLWPVRLYNNFPHYSTNSKIFEKKVIEHKICIFCTILSEIFITLRRIQEDITINMNWSSCTVPDILVGF
jgi:hypothetical protein